MLEGSLSNPEGLQYLTKRYGDDLPTVFHRLANNAYMIADVMMEERLKNIEVHEEKYVTTRTDDR